MCGGLLGLLVGGIVRRALGGGRGGLLLGSVGPATLKNI